MEFLVFQIHGTLSSFGDTAVGEYRPSMDHPSRSMVLGLLAGSLGLERNRMEELNALEDSLGLATLSLNSGILLRDYHTAQVPGSPSLKKHPAYTRKDELDRPELNTILSTRDYRQDAVYRICIWSKGKKIQLSQLAAALKEPHFSPYLGRKSCPPSIPFCPEIVSAKSVEEAMTGYRPPLFEELDLLYADKTDFLLYMDPDSPVKERKSAGLFRRKDRLIHRGNWQFGDREELLVRMEAKDVFQ